MCADKVETLKLPCETRDSGEIYFVRKICRRLRRYAEARGYFVMESAHVASKM